MTRMRRLLVARHRLAVLLAAAGSITMLSAAVGLVGDDAGGDSDSGRVHQAAGEAITVQPSAYEPGQSSGWHSHDGVHVVTVLSGTLTVDDGDLGHRAYGPGETYLGGRQPHQTRNDGDEPVHMVVTYVLDQRGHWKGTDR